MFTVVFFMGLVVRLTVKDHFAIICTIYYAMPPLVLAVSAAVGGVYWLSRGKKILAGVMIPAALACMLWCQQTCYVNNQTAIESGGFGESLVDENAEPAAREKTADNTTRSEPRKPCIRLLYWNPWQGKLGWEGVVSTIRGHDPDVVALVESGRASEINRRGWHNSFPGYEMTDGRELMLTLCRGRIIRVSQRRLTPDSLYQTVDLQTRGNRFKLVLVDLGSAPFRSRARRLETLAHLAKKLDSEPLIMAGDFNLPHDSVHFELFDGRLQNAFRAVGDGYAPTWPMPLPLIQIDHVWTNRHVQVERCVTGWSCYSDHRPVIVDFRLSNSNSSAATNAAAPPRLRPPR